MVTNIFKEVYRGFYKDIESFLKESLVYIHMLTCLKTEDVPLPPTLP